MIAYIKGILTYIQDDSIIVDVQGVGYEIICANPFVFQSFEHNEVFVYTYHHVREDTQLLYGFKNEEEKYLFTKLISVSGIGPKGALAILASVDVAGFAAAIEREDDAFLTSFPGIGKKTARQIILDLKGKLTVAVDYSSATESAFKQNKNEMLVQEAQEALKALGYTEKEIKTVIPTLQKENTLNTDELIRKALGLLMK
ncbi:MAG: Holliday junction branch migration protein RuvA [Bacillota bacterium]|uniref:Holliday junction branch migration protein RuvA n=1 Tax=Virgibacillus TaxID=84406 RepID=UPI0003F8B37C|nr:MULTISPECIES: Holliday junction branch migration protein RuvA [Bacillaceae]MCC2251142.1 Holliday junction branch migration protein RuvA [Virgibacillus sp. AGTR]MDY7045279.1 Holliday junction branch migration protein RuvA [Virgibacillus sp. M23]QRZ17547.1 Holliday junction branch migration protein RuvA [Virgibacillus sp. AGTR]WBX79034.1 Holliday junction branch migration protein RuvA [Virgibacillus salarius]